MNGRHRVVITRSGRCAKPLPNALMMDELVVVIDTVESLTANRSAT
ncbi:MAG: hypothetical protein H7319_09770 [Spirosoma sp.]|nr:hypothetical protein [Spirosoma sp.]